MPRGDAIRWHNSVYAITWAKVEFVKWRDDCAIRHACERLAEQGMKFTLVKGRKQHEPHYSVEWIDGEKVERYPRGEEWEYEASCGKGESRDGENLRKLYYAARAQIKADDTIRRNAELYLEMLKDDYSDGFLGGIIDSSRVAPPRKK